MSVLSSACIFAIEKNTIHSIDIEAFRCNNTKKAFRLSEWQHHETSKRVRNFST